MLCELVRVQTSDGLRLDGAYYRAARDGESTPQGIVLFLHGAGSNFYGGAISEVLAEALPSQGWSVLRANTRGHDGVYAAHMAGRGVRLGAAYEIIDDSKQDSDAWVRWAREQDSGSVVLAGHSLGAIKTIYALAQGEDDATPSPSSRITQPDGMIAVSPPRLSRSAFAYGPQSSEFFATLAEAEQSVAAGDAMRLIESPFPFPMLITCGTFVDKYGGERYNVLELVDRIGVPSLYVFGERELATGGVAFAGLSAAIEQRAREDLADVRVVAGADHFYQGLRPELAEEIAHWLAHWQRQFKATSAR